LLCTTRRERVGLYRILGRITGTIKFIIFPLLIFKNFNVLWAKVRFLKMIPDTFSRSLRRSAFFYQMGLLEKENLS
jgi:hypothetical protein